MFSVVRHRGLGVCWCRAWTGFWGEAGVLFGSLFCAAALLCWGGYTHYLWIEWMAIYSLLLWAVLKLLAVLLMEMCILKSYIWHRQEGCFYWIHPCIIEHIYLGNLNDGQGVFLSSNVWFLLQFFKKKVMLYWGFKVLVALHFLFIKEASLYLH